MYKTINGPRGSIRYMKDNRLVAKKNIPADILLKLEVGMKAVDEKPVEKQPLTCIFCGAATKITRFLNMQSIAVCEEHYYSKNVGQTIQQFNKVSNDRSGTNRDQGVEEAII